MKLIEIIEKLDSFSDEDTIYAAEPWSEKCQAVVETEPPSGGLPEKAQELGLKYFLEVFLAREFLEGWIANLQAEPSLQDKCQRLIQYAVTDA